MENNILSKEEQKIILLCSTRENNPANKKMKR